MIISDFGSVVTGKTPSTKRKEYWNGDIPFVTPGDLQRTKHIIITARQISNIGMNSVKGSILPKGAICVSCIGNIGYVGKTVRKCVSNQQINSIIVNKDHNEDYVYYLMKSLWPYFKNYEGQSTTLSILNKGQFSKIEVADRSRDDEDRIAEVLNIIDNKIELNIKINENLEQQAQALFKSFFIVYTPYGGMAPTSWKKVSLDDVCSKITDGSHYSPVDVPGASYPMYSVKDMETYGFNSSYCKHITEDEFKKMRQSDCVPLIDDILVAKDGSYLKEIFICSEEKNEAILSSIAIFRPNPEIVKPEFLLYLLKQPSVRKDVGDNYVSGSALPRIVLKDFKKYSFILPPIEEQQKIWGVLHMIRMQTKANVDENHSLSTIRDALLPKLMSGELDVTNLDI